MSEHVFEFTDENFEADVLQAETPVLVDFWAAWCGPCRAVGPLIDQLAVEFGGEIKIGKLNVDENQQIAQNLAITSIPSVLIFDKGTIVERLVGVQPRSRYESAIREVVEPVG